MASALGARVGEHPLDLGSRPARVDRRLLPAPPGRNGPSGERAPEEERQARGELDVARCDRCRPGRRRRRALGAEHEPRIRQDRLHDQPDAVLEAARLAALAVEPHRVLQVRGRRRAAERALGERLRDRQRASSLPRSAEVGRHENTRCRLGVSETPVTRSGPWIVTSWMCGSAVIAEAGADARVDQRAVDRDHQVVHRAREVPREDHRDPLRAGLDVNRRALDGHRLLIGVAHPGVHSRAPRRARR